MCCREARASGVPGSIAMIPSMKACHLLRACFVLWAVLLQPQFFVFALAPHNAGSKVPFVGCRSDGQTGPLKAPRAELKKVAIPAEIAGHLAYYKAQDGFGVLAPRGWHCFATYGSNGVNLYVTPAQIKGPELLSSGWKGFSGQAIQVSESIGDTSGRLAVAQTIARVFPDRKDFVDRVVSEGVEPAASFPSGAYPTDKLTYRWKNAVEFETPPDAKGLGTDSKLLVNGSPVRGVAILFGQEPSLVKASVRLPSDSLVLTKAIINQLENEVRAAGRQ